MSDERDDGFNYTDDGRVFVKPWCVPPASDWVRFDITDADLEAFGEYLSGDYASRSRDIQRTGARRYWAKRRAAR